MPDQSIARTVDYAAIDRLKQIRGARSRRRIWRAGRSSLQATQCAAAAARWWRRGTYDRGNTSIVSAAQRLTQQGGFDTVLIADGARLSAQAAAAARPTGATSPPLARHRIVERRSQRRVQCGAARRAVLRPFRTAGSTSFPAATRPASARRRTGSPRLGYDAVLLTLRIARDWRPGSGVPHRTNARSRRIPRPGRRIPLPSPTAWSNARWKCARSAEGRYRSFRPRPPASTNEDNLACALVTARFRGLIALPWLR